MSLKTEFGLSLFGRRHRFPDTIPGDNVSKQFMFYWLHNQRYHFMCPCASRQRKIFSFGCTTSQVDLYRREDIARPAWRDS